MRTRDSLRREFRTREESDRSREPVARLVSQEPPTDWPDVDHLGLNLRAVTTERDEAPDELVREPCRPAERHAKTDEIFGVHEPSRSP
jgi:hypothetical protein